jgi:hypothetical protein
MRISALAALLSVLSAPLAPAQMARAGATPTGSNTQITDSGLPSFRDADDPDIAESNGVLYATWKDDRANTDESIFFAKSNDGGATWSANQRVSALPYDDWADDPVIAVQPNGAIWILWYLFFSDAGRANDVRLARSTDGGASFQLQTFYNGDNGYEDVRSPQIAVDESTGNVHVLIHEYFVEGASEGYDIFLFTFSAAAQMWSATRVNDLPRTGRRVDAPTQDEGPRMSLTAREGKVCAAWEDQRSGNAIYSACSTNAGGAFGANVAISPADAVFPRIALAPGSGVFATYTLSADAERNVRLRHSSDLGATWNEPKPITDALNGTKVLDWDLAADANGQLVLAWVEDGGPTSSGNLYLTTSADLGQNLTTILVEDNSGEFPTAARQFRVAMTTSGTPANARAHLAWRDDRNTTHQIWTAQFALDGTPPTAPGMLTALGEDTSILLTWSPASDASGISAYRIFRAIAAGGPFSEIAPLRVSTTSYRDVELDSATYFYKVAAVDGTGNTGPLSNVASAAAQAGANAPLNGTLAYQVGGDVRLRDLPNLTTERALTAGKTPLFSRDGARVYYQIGNAIASQRANGGDGRTFFQDASVTEHYDLAADEARFASIRFSQFASPFAPGNLCNVFEPHVGTTAQATYRRQFDIAGEVALSADGQWLAYRYIGFCAPSGYGLSTPHNFCLVNLSTNARNCVGANFLDPDFAPGIGSTQLVFGANLTGQFEIWKAQVTNGALSSFVQLTRGPAGQPSRGPAWSSDGNWVVFQRDVDAGAGEDWRLFAVRADGAGLRALNVSGVNAAWHGGGPAAPLPSLPERARLPIVTR